MMQMNLINIKSAVEAVYTTTEDTHFKEAEVKFDYLKIGYLGTENHGEIRITRSRKDNDLTYKLYTKHDANPLMTVFGCWPQRFVVDVFTRALEHFYDDYSTLTFNNESGWVRF